MYLKDCKRFSIIKTLPSCSDDKMIEKIKKIFAREVFMTLGRTAKSSVHELFYTDRTKCKFVVEFEKEQPIPELVNSIIVDLVRLCVIRAEEDLKKRQAKELRDNVIKSVLRYKKQKSKYIIQ